MKTPITAGDRIYRGLRDMIVYGDLKPGCQLVQREIAAKFGTSNIPVVEAIRRLEHDGLVVGHARWGARVKEWTPADFEGVYLMREALEGIASRLYAERATELEKLALVEQGRLYDIAVADADERAGDEANIALHMHVVRCAKSPSLVHFAENSCVITTTSKNAAWRALAAEELVSKVGSHDELIAALNSGDPARAERAGREHVRSAFDLLTGLLRAEPATALAS